MKRLVLIFLFILMTAVAGKAQNASFKRIDGIDCRPLVTVNGKVVDPLSFLALNRDDIKTFKVLTPTEAIKKFGNGRSQFGAVEITLIKIAKTFTWPEVAKRFYLIPGSLPITAKLYYGYFGGLVLTDPQSFIISVSKTESMGVTMNDFDLDKPVVSIGIKEIEVKDKTKGQSLARPFDKDIDAVKKIFDAESEKRVEIRDAKPRIEG